MIVRPWTVGLVTAWNLPCALLQALFRRNPRGALTGRRSSACTSSKLSHTIYRGCPLRVSSGFLVHIMFIIICYLTRFVRHIFRGEFIFFLGDFSCHLRIHVACPIIMTSGMHRWRMHVRVAAFGSQVVPLLRSQNVEYTWLLPFRNFVLI